MPNRLSSGQRSKRDKVLAAQGKKARAAAPRTAASAASAEAAPPDPLVQLDVLAWAATRFRFPTMEEVAAAARGLIEDHRELQHTENLIEQEEILKDEPGVDDPWEPREHRDDEGVA